MSTGLLYADVILPLSVSGIFTYRIPGELREFVDEGVRVEVQFGSKRIYSAIVRRLHNETPQVETKELLSVLDEKPIVSSRQLMFWEWISEYYMCTIGEVMNAALPAGLKPESESRLSPNPEFKDWISLNRHEQLIMDVIEAAGEITLGKLASSGTEKSLMHIVRMLVDKEAIVLNEVFKRKVRVREQTFIRLTDEWYDEAKLSALLDMLGKAPKQLELLQNYIGAAGLFTENEKRTFEKNKLPDTVQAAVLNALVKKGVFEIYKLEQGRDPVLPGKLSTPKKLTGDQAKALKGIRSQFEKMQTVMLYGITSSGKTEVYIHLIREMIRNGKQTLYLLPEIALTTQIIERLKSVFGDEVGVYHSRFSDTDRVKIYRNLAGLTPDKPYSVILGVRSAIFLPFSNLGLVIVDEEHETTYKQFDPAPRYHARDSVNILAMYHNARVLMGSATPSFESWYNVKTAKYGLVSMDRRYGNAVLPEIVIADVKEARRKKQLRSVFTPELLEGIEKTVAAGRQVILFQNRRGYSNYLWCPDCNYIARCSRCDVSLTYHKHSNELVCHYCGATEKVPPRCPDCSSPRLQMKGFGTEKVEDELGLLLPGIRIGRLDTDVARSRNSYEQVLNAFADHQLDVLVGTQLISKGLDFSDVDLVGVLDADSMLNFPDFRAFERSFQLMMQVSGRAGRRERQGKVIIQAGDPKHPVILNVIRQDYIAMFSEQMEERRVFGYPPYSRLIRLTLRHQVPSFVDASAFALARELKDVFGIRVLGPQPPSAGRRYGLYHQEILIKIERAASFEKARGLVGESIARVLSSPVHKAVKVSIDIDPY